MSEKRWDMACSLLRMAVSVLTIVTVFCYLRTKHDD